MNEKSLAGIYEPILRILFEKNETIDLRTIDTIELCENFKIVFGVVWCLSVPFFIGCSNSVDFANESKPNIVLNFN